MSVIEFNSKNFNGDYYAAIGDHLGERYLDYGFTKGTVGEVDFLVQAMGIHPGQARILDVGCGVGRHSLELARRGFKVVGLDVSPKFVELANQAAKCEGLSAEFLLGDARQMHLADQDFDAAVCLCEGAFGLAGSDEGHVSILRGIARALKPTAPFILTAINAYGVVRKGAPNFDIYSCTTRDEVKIEGAAGQTRDVELYTSAFTFRELKLMLALSGFQVEAGYGCEAGRFSASPLTVDSTEVMVIARRAGMG
ncbi:MAG TPA: class I SAM-dependent methyltransferase [Tepidisphaeraceae bacterium]|jgi:ubiquinone/menaquinone biosynthesis C-methylase UbiE